MKIKLVKGILIGALGVISLLFFSSSHQKNIPNLQLNINDNGRTIIVSVGQPITITLSFGGGDYYYGANYDTSIIKLYKHFYSIPSGDSKDNKKSIIGTLGRDTFEFIPLKFGSSVIEIQTPPQSTNSKPDVGFKVTVIVK